MKGKSEIGQEFHNFVHLCSHSQDGKKNLQSDKVYRQYRIWYLQAFVHFRFYATKRRLEEGSRSKASPIHVLHQCCLTCWVTRALCVFFSKPGSAFPCAYCQISCFIPGKQSLMNLFHTMRIKLRIHKWKYVFYLFIHKRMCLFYLLLYPVFFPHCIPAYQCEHC